jgi:DNA-binding MarR family transcriptional regulator
MMTLDVLRPARRGERGMATRARPTVADEVLLTAVRLAMAVSIRAADQLGDVSTVQLRALTVLRGNSGANLVQLAQGMGVTVSTASRLVDRLVAAGLVDRRPSPQTRREISLALTRTGRARLRRYDDLRLSEVRACLDDIPPEQRDAVIAAVKQLTDAAASRADASLGPAAH